MEDSRQFSSTNILDVLQIKHQFPFITDYSLDYIDDNEKRNCKLDRLLTYLANYTYRQLPSQCTCVLIEEVNEDYQSVLMYHLMGILEQYSKAKFYVLKNNSSFLNNKYLISKKKLKKEYSNYLNIVSLNQVMYHNSIDRKYKETNNYITITPFKLLDIKTLIEISNLFVGYILPNYEIPKEIDTFYEDVYNGVLSDNVRSSILLFNTQNIANRYLLVADNIDSKKQSCLIKFLNIHSNVIPIYIYTTNNTNKNKINNDLIIRSNQRMTSLNSIHSLIQLKNTSNIDNLAKSSVLGYLDSSPADESQPSIPEQIDNSIQFKYFNMEGEIMSYE